MKVRSPVGTWLNPLLTCGLVAAVVASAALGAFAPVDQALRAWRFELLDRSPSGQTVFVEIDARSLDSLGVWPWPRQVHAQILDRLLDLGAAEVVFDIDFSTAATEQGDAAFEAALRRAGGYAYLAAFQQFDAHGQRILNLPLPRFARFGDPVLVNVDGDGTGLLRSVPRLLADPAIPSVALVLARGANVDAPSIVIDYGIDLREIDRVSAVDILQDPDFDAAQVRDKQVIVGASAIELRDYFRVPRFGVVPGALVQLAAAETLKAGRELRDLRAAPGAIIAVLATLLFLFERRRQPLWRILCGTAGIALLCEAAALLLFGQGGILVDTAIVHAGVGGLVLLALLQDRARLWRRSHRQHARLLYLARYDQSTQALTRQAFLSDLEGGQGKQPIVVLHLLRFEGVIACLGHDVAELAAAEVVRRLSAYVQATPARVGPDTFAFSSSADLEKLAALLETAIMVEGHSIILGAVFGVAPHDPEASPGERLRCGEVALLTARQSGKEMVIFEPDQGDRIQQRRVLDVALREALERQEFFVLFQPQVDMATGKLLGAEALVRWQHPTLGLVSPADFIPLAEETGLIVQLGELVLEQACKHAAKWHSDLSVSVNVSGVQFKLIDIVESVKRALIASGLPASRLVIEITESLLVGSNEATIAALEALRALGCRLALDDFGTGYSSLSYLARLPVDELKIDQSFVRALPDPQQEAIVETIVLLATQLDKVVVAEGVETAEQRTYLLSIGCTVGQGYLFGRPADATRMLLYDPEPSAA